MTGRQLKPNRGPDGTHPLDKSFTPDPEGVVEVIGSDGLHKQQMVHYPPDSPNAFSGLDRLTNEGFWREVEDMLSVSNEKLEEHGFPRADRRVAYNRSGFWCYVEDVDGRPRDWGLTAGIGSYAKNWAPVFSKEWYWEKIGFECWNLLEHQRPKEPDTFLARQAMHLVYLITDFEWRTAFKSDIIHGRRFRKKKNENLGSREITKQRQGFLSNISDKLSPDSRRYDLIALLAVKTAPERVQELWGCGEAEAERKVKKFLYNHGL